MTPLAGVQTDVLQVGSAAVQMGTHSHTQGGTNIMVCKLVSFPLIVYGFVHYSIALHTLLLIKNTLI